MKHPLPALCVSFSFAFLFSLGSLAQNVVITAPEDREITCDVSVIPCLDFDSVDNNENLLIGNTPVFISAGSNTGIQQPRRIQSSSPPSVDRDLGTPNTGFGGPGIGEGGEPGAAYPNFRPQSFIMIVQTPGSIAPNDLNARGAYLEVDLTSMNGVSPTSVELLDLEEGQRTRIELLGSQRELLGAVSVPATGDNGAITVALPAVTAVYYIKVILDGSGALSRICFNNPEADFGQPTIDESALSAPFYTWFEDRFVYGDCGLDRIERTWFVTDCKGKTNSDVQVIRVTDTLPPVFNETLPVDLTVACDAIPEPVVLTATDSCDPNVEVVFSETLTEADDNCPGSYQIVRTYTATDCAGNEAVFVQTIQVTDSEAPTLEGELEESITVSCEAIPDVPVLTFTDTCSASVTVSFEEQSNFPGTGDQYEILRSWTVSDGCGNEALFEQELIVLNNEVTPVSLTGTLCVDDASVNLDSYLEGALASGGTWVVTEGNTALNGNSFDPSSGTGTYRFTYSVASGTCNANAQLTLTVHADCRVLPCSSASDVVISKTVTPNSDGYNDFFVITGVDEACGFIIQVRIFNRWGEQVYRSDNYQNDWSGNSSNGQLPAGTYYYIVTLVDSGLDPLTGYIYLAGR